MSSEREDKLVDIVATLVKFTSHDKACDENQPALDGDGDCSQCGYYRPGPWSPAARRTPRRYPGLCHCKPKGPCSCGLRRIYARIDEVV